jgi:hypothetical protein
LSPKKLIKIRVLKLWKHLWPGALLNVSKN